MPTSCTFLHFAPSSLLLITVIIFVSTISAVSFRGVLCIHPDPDTDDSANLGILIGSRFYVLLVSFNKNVAAVSVILFCYITV